MRKTIRYIRYLSRWCCGLTWLLFELKWYDFLVYFWTKLIYSGKTLPKDEHLCMQISWHCWVCVCARFTPLPSEMSQKIIVICDLVRFSTSYPSIDGVLCRVDVRHVHSFDRSFIGSNIYNAELKSHNKCIMFVMRWTLEVLLTYIIVQCLQAEYFTLYTQATTQSIIHCTHSVYGCT